MRVIVLASPGAPHQVEHQAALVQGLRALGVEAVAGRHVPEDARHVACWGWHTGARLRQEGREVLVMERGYLGDRFSWSSLAWNGLNGRGRFAAAPDDGGARFRQHFGMQAWQDRPDGYALIMGQVPGDASLQGVDLMPWYSAAADEARAAGIRPVFRQHPQAIKRFGRRGPAGVQRAEGTLEEALAGARQVITYNSNAGVDAVLAGVSVVADNEGSMAWPVAGRQIGVCHTPDREKWAHDLAWKQWRLQEIADGTALKGLM